MNRPTRPDGPRGEANKPDRWSEATVFAALGAAGAIVFAILVAIRGNQVALVITAAVSALLFIGVIMQFFAWPILRLARQFRADSSTESVLVALSSVDFFAGIRRLGGYWSPSHGFGSYIVVRSGRQGLEIWGRQGLLLRLSQLAHEGHTVTTIGASSTIEISVKQDGQAVPLQFVPCGPSYYPFFPLRDAARIAECERAIARALSD